jgi:DnaK suppressor protein
VRKNDQKKFLKVLNESRQQLLGNARRAMTGDIHLDPDDFADEIDSASSESGLAFIGRLREREKHLIQKIDLSISKIEAGTYGTCVMCEEDIGFDRLMARPVADLCIDCKSQQERLER